jgi:hypothetical protein
MNPVEYHHHKAYLEELRRQLEEDLAAQAALQNKQPIYAPLLASLGNQMMNLGVKLQLRYGELLDDSTNPPAPYASEF